MKSQKVLVHSTKMSLGVITRLAHSPAKMLLTASSAQENAKSTRGIRSVATDALQSAARLLARGNQLRNAGSIAWSLSSVSTRSVRASAWTLLRKENARLSASSTQEILTAASVVIALWSARRNHCGENAQLSVRSMQATLTVVRRHVRQNAPTRGGKSAVRVECRSVMAFQVAVQRSLMWCLGTGCTWRMINSDFLI